MVSRLGLTMRITIAPEYDEARDALARDWTHLLETTLPGIPWIPLPNIGPAVVDLARTLQIDGFIFTGGNDIGDAPERDTTERALLTYCLEARRPTLGICRGLQMLQTILGGTLAPCSTERHVATRHEVHLNEASPVSVAGDRCLTVNSFHRFAIAEGRLAPPLETFAVTDDGFVEGARHTVRPVVGVMWHPERRDAPTSFDRSLIRNLFGQARE